MTFEYTVSQQITKGDFILFAYAHPFTLNDINLSINEFEKKIRAETGIYFHKERLIDSLEGHPVHFLTFTKASQNEVDEAEFDKIENPN